MKKFKFQLETLLKVTRRKKDDAELKFAEASRYLEACRAKLQELIRELQEGQEEFAEMTAEGKDVQQLFQLETQSNRTPARRYP